MTYTQKIGTTKYQVQESPEKNGQIRWDHQTHTIAGMDSGGGFCASLATGLDASNSRAEAVEKASPYQDSISYSYRVHTAREFQGMRCGSFFRWGPQRISSGIQQIISGHREVQLNPKIA